MSIVISLSSPVGLAIILGAVVLPIACLLLYRSSRRRVWLWLGGLSGVILLLEVGFVILLIRKPLWFMELLSALSRD